MKKLQAVGDNIIVKIFIKQSKAGIIIPTDGVIPGHNTKLKDNDRYDAVAEVYSVGEKVTLVKPGNKITYLKPMFMILNMKLICDEPYGEDVGYDFAKMKEEDVLGKIIEE